MEKWILRKYVPMVVYFKCKDRTGQTNTSTPGDSMKFDTQEQAIDFNHDSLYGEYEAVPFLF